MKKSIHKKVEMLDEDIQTLKSVLRILPTTEEVKSSLHKTVSTILSETPINVIKKYLVKKQKFNSYKSCEEWLRVMSYFSSTINHIYNLPNYDECLETVKVDDVYKINFINGVLEIKHIQLTLETKKIRELCDFIFLKGRDYDVDFFFPPSVKEKREYFKETFEMFKSDSVYQQQNVTTN